MKICNKVTLLALAQLAFTLDLIQSFTEQSCTRGTIFSLRIDDHFDEVLINASVISPKFLSISERTVQTSNVFTLNPEFKMNFTDMTFYEDKLLILEGAGLVIYKDITSNGFLFDENPELLQYYKDESLSSYSRVKGGKVLALFNRTSVGLFLIEDLMFPIKLAEIWDLENVIDVEVYRDYIIVISNTILKVFLIIDYEIGWVSETSQFDLKSLNYSQVWVQGAYVSNSAIYLIDLYSGIFHFSFMPLKFIQVLPYPGSKIAGTEGFLLIDGKLELDLGSLTSREFPSTSDCIYTAIDKEFIYCASTKQLMSTSRLLNLTEAKFVGLMHQVTAYRDLLFIGLYNRIEAFQPSLGAVIIQGRAPDEVSDVRVVFNVSSSSESLCETFTLSIQYSLTNVIVFILLSFITVFGLVFLCSFICKCLTHSPEPAKETPIQGTEGLPSTERQLQSDRELLPRYK